MAKRIKDTTVVTGEVRFSYVHLLEPYAFGDEDPKYSLTILIPKNTDNGVATYNAIKEAIQAAAERGAQKHFGGRIPTNVVNTLKDGDTETDDMGDLRNIKNPEYKGHWYMSLRSNKKPIILDSQRNPITDELDVYSGVYGRVALTTFAYSGDGRRGVSAFLNHVQILRDGEPLGGEISIDVFDDESDD